jgi:serine/threonine-protein kinase SRPK3
VGTDYCVAIKILTAVATAGHSQKLLLELELLQRIQSVPPSSGRDRLSTLKDHFELQGPHGKHLCFVLLPLGASLKTLHDTAPDRILPQPIAKRIVKQILQALVYLHETCRIIHTGLLALPPMCDEFHG